MKPHIIVGAGINGLFTAYYLMLAGEKVVLLDQGDIGKESTWAGGGILSPLHPWRYPEAVTTLASWGQQRYPEILCFSGHTHMLNLFEQRHTGEINKKKLDFQSVSLDQRNRYLVIVGSVGQPRDSLNDKAKYAVWDTLASSCNIRQIPYDVDTTIELLKRHNFPPQNAKRLKWSKKDNR